MSIIQKQLLIFLTIGLIPMLAISGILYVTFQQALRTQSIEQVEYAATIHKNRLENSLAQNEERLKSFTNRRQLRLSLNSYNQRANITATDFITALLRDVGADMKNFKNISVLDPQGVVLSSTNQKIVGTSLAAEDYYLKGRSMPDVSKFFFKDQRGEVNLYLVGPIIFEQKVVGVAVIESDIKNLLVGLEDYTGLGSTGEVLLAKREANGDAVFLTPTRFEKSAALEKRIKAGEATSPVIKALEREGTYIGATDYRRQPVIAVGRHIKGPDWSLVAKIDRAEVDAPINNLRDTLLAVIFMTSVVLVFLALALARKVSEPILELSDAAMKISEGDLTARVDVATHDEFGKLGSTFNDMAQNIERLDEAKSEFVSLASHQLRTPATAVKGLISVMIENYSNALDEKQKGLLRTAYEENEKQIYIINSLLDVADVDSGEMTLSRSEINLYKLTKDMISEHQQTLIMREQKIFISQPGTSPVHVWADPGKISLIIDNLISNASKYSPHGSTIEIKLEQLKTKVKITVKDNGFGIKQADMGRLFKKFSRIPNPNSVKAGGSGLGLFLVKKIVDLHKGQIAVSSKIGKGTAFTIYLPGKRK